MRGPRTNRLSDPHLPAMNSPCRLAPGGHEMTKQGIARYDESRNELEVIRPGESSPRRIRCTNLDPRSKKVWGVEVHDDQIWVLASERGNQRPNRKYIYSFKSLGGGSSTGY